MSEWTGEGHVKRWDSDGRVVRDSFRCGGNVTSVAVTPDGTLIAAGSRDHTATIWRATDGAVIFPPIRHGSPLTAIALDDEGKTMATADEQSVFLWDTESLQLISRMDCDFQVSDLRVVGCQVYMTTAKGASFLWEPAESETGFASLQAKSYLHSGKKLTLEGHIEPLKPNELRELWITSVDKLPEEQAR